MTAEETLQKAIETAFREGYAAGYENGSSDQCSYEWGSGSKGRKSLEREKDQAWQDSDAIKTCPKCGSTNTDKRHHDGSTFICETDWRQCEDCEHQWDHQ